MSSAEPLPDFVGRRRADWDALAKLLDALDHGALVLEDVSRLDALYRRAASDLARAATWYPGTDALRFLNQLCGRAYGAIYRPRPRRGQALVRFYAQGFPRLVREEWRAITLATGLLVFGVVLGASAVLAEPALALTLVPPHLRDWVARRELWTDDLLRAMPPSTVATAILTNNLQVTIASFALGVTGGLGTALVLLKNGLDNAAIVAHCAQEGLGPGILTFMAAHGPVELSILCITGGAGLMVGRALVAPGELPRGEALRLHAGRAVRLVLGCAPALAFIGVVEGFVSPGDLFSPALKVALGGCLFLGFWSWLLVAGRQRLSDRRAGLPAAAP